MSPVKDDAPVGAAGKPTGTLQGLRRYVLRPLYLFVVLSLVVVACLQATGRIALYLLPEFSDDINQLLASRNITLQGIEGDWRGFNPVLRVARAEFSAGHVTGIELELDLLESALRSVLVPARLHVEETVLNLEQTASGWALQGMDGQNEMPDFSGTLRHIDDLTLTATVNLLGADASRQAVHGVVRLANVQPQHYLELEITTPGAVADDEGLRMRLWQHDEVLFSDAARTAVDVRGSVRVPSLLSRMPGLTIALRDGTWADQNGQGGGSIGVDVQGITLPGVAVPLELLLRLEARREGRSVSGVVSELQVVGTQASLDLSGARLALDVGEPPSALSDWMATNELTVAPATADGEDASATTSPAPLMRLWVEALSLGAITRFADAQLSGWDPAGRWISSLALRGDLLNVHAFVDPGAPLSLGYAATLSDLHMQGYKGAPTLLGGQGQVWGHAAGVAVQLSADDVQLQFPDLFDNMWQVGHIQGVVKAWFQSGYFALQGKHLKAEVEGSQVAGEFSLTRPDARYEQRVGLTLNLDQAGLLHSKRFVPYKIPEELTQWLETGPRAGQLSDVRFAYHGQVHTRPDELGRRIELLTRLSEGTVVYESSWPAVTELDAVIHVAGIETRIDVARGVTQGAVLGNSHLVLHDNGAYAKGRVRAAGDGSHMLDFVRQSPLRDSLSFIAPDWQANGVLELEGDLLVPIKTGMAPPLAVDLEFAMANLDLNMPGYRTQLAGLAGSGTFSLPHNLEGAFEGLLFDKPARFKAYSDEAWVRFDISGSAVPDDVYALINYPDIGIIDGEFAFSSTLNLAMQPALVTHIEVASPLQGLAIDLPAEFAKEADAQVDTELNVQFLNEYQSVSWRYKGTQGWIHFGDEIERGAIGIGQSPPMTDEAQQAIIIAGKLPRARLSDWVSTDGESQVSLPLDWIIRDLEVGQFLLNELQFDDLVLNARQQDSASQFRFVSPTMVGDVQIPASGPMRIALEYLRLPDPGAVALGGPQNVLESPAAAEPAFSLPQVDPLPRDVGPALPAALLSVDQLVIGDAPFGRWDFEIVPAKDAVTFKDFNMDVNGVHIAGGNIRWDLPGNTSLFSGLIELDDLQTTLPQWDYAASVQTSDAAVFVNGHWAGSPANVSLLGLNGELKFDADDGRFLDVESAGGLRIMSLLNFSSIAKRMALDFSDVTQDGLAFENIQAQVRLENGRLTFLERMTVESSSSNFEVGGTVDLNNGLLDNEMIVTLPVSDSLPWYGVYLALANPLAGLGVILGERVLRKPIQAFSTAKFEIKGTLADPQVNFVSLWDRSISAPPAAIPNAGETISEPPKAAQKSAPAEVAPDRESAHKADTEPAEA